jgi:hypothetical protein
MMRSVLRELLIGILVCGLIFSSFVGCGEKDDDEEGQAPELPPEASMTMDFSAFGGEKMAPSAQLPGKNFSNAAIRILALNLAVVVAMTPAVATFKAAYGADPVEQDDGSWLWPYTINILGHKIEAELTGSLEGFATAWSMRVTSDSFDPPLEDFEWYTGECSLDGTSGDWLFFDYKIPDTATKLATIEWKVESTSKSELTFTNITEGRENSGDILTYSVDGTTALVTFYDASEDITADITWDLDTIAGSIEVPGYNNGERAYWDEDKQDVVP